MIRFGIVVDIDETKGRVRVQLPDRDNVSSYWLAVLKAKTLQDKFYGMPDLNEHVALLLDENGEEGVVLGAIYSDADPVPVSSRDKYHVTFQDGTVIEYDRKEHRLTADVKGDIAVKATGTLDAEIEGETTVYGHDLVTVKSATSLLLKAPLIAMESFSGGGATGTFQGNYTLIGTLTVQGNISATGTITDSGGNTNHHSHP